MTKYEPITFNKLSEAIAYVEDGGELYGIDDKIISVVDLASLWIDKYNEFFTKPKPANWYEKLDGTIENGVLCRCTDYNGNKYSINLVVESNKGYVTDSGERYFYAIPLTHTEIQKFMDNAPEEV